MIAIIAQAGNLREYVDPANRFRFSYPADFGSTSRGTDDGFGDRAAAIHFATFSADGIGGEAVLTRGGPVVDIQALGGLYDAITLQIFPDAIRRMIVQNLPRLTPGNVCQQLAQEQHLDPQLPAFAALTAQQKSAIASTDRMRNVSPRVSRCDVNGSTVTFDKEVTTQPGGTRQHVYGAIRFLDGSYSTFQIVRAGSAPRAATLDQMTGLVASWRVR